jgi:hypothetical protein
MTDMTGAVSIADDVHRALTYAVWPWHCWTQVMTAERQIDSAGGAPYGRAPWHRRESA